MNKSENNPNTNILKSGVEESQIIEAVSTSGYPLQTIVHEILAKSFYVQEEWGYIDSDTNEERAIDLLAEKRLYEFSEPQPRVRPTLDLIIECKQSELPYIFFLTKDKPYTPKFPMIAGLESNNVVITSDDDPSSWNYSVINVLSLDQHPFLRGSPVFCNTFSKCTRKGNKLELSGSQSYQGLILPLLKSVLHFEKCERPPKTAYYFDCHVSIGIGVIDGPMVGVRTGKNESELEMLPWVRVVRHQAPDEDVNYHRSNTHAIDIVQKDYFLEYLEKHLMPFANDFSKLALKHHKELADGKGFVQCMGKDSWNNIEKRLKPLTIKGKTQRYSGFFKNIIKLFKIRSKKTV